MPAARDNTVSVSGSELSGAIVVLAGSLNANSTMDDPTTVTEAEHTEPWQAVERDG
jgi:hypothetical protein